MTCYIERFESFRGNTYYRAVIKNEFCSTSYVKEEELPKLLVMINQWKKDGAEYLGIIDWMTNKKYSLKVVEVE